MPTTAVLKDQALRRLLDAVITLQGADQNGSSLEIEAAAVELEIAKRQSQKLLYPEEPHEHTTQQFTGADDPDHS